MGDKNNDRVLVERVQQGDKSAFDLLVLKYQHKIVKLVMRYVRDSSEALDVTQEAFLKAYRALPGFRGDSAFYTWLYRIAINTAKNHIVAQSRRPPDTDLEVSDAEQFEGAGELKEFATPERLALRDEIQAAVAGAIDDLPEDLRMAITLRELEGMSYEEIAETMGLTTKAVKSLLSRARGNLRVLLEPYVTEGAPPGTPQAEK